ncbi:hypothetical protein PPTG_03082 [Phytophthora nicotianae INRA-310]|uniref:Chitin-binding type-4 domain-containing protein n=1 Tax=Phytophthora nicotianae (strain INRA-310) TaxID=761204 RepID=W2R3L4_PHYN3|nr:hypothetical protein PPTG_03082 [Phytophthora nicotianae INRA-310]ETN19978.1 hypothetical protein PPTG_03082 [Phytophthora nicotianae INRA-310]
MQPTGIVSLAMVATAAVLFTTADAHGQMLVPDYRQISAKFRKDSGALSQAGDQELQYAPVENLSGRSQKDFPEAATFNLMNGCRGTVYEEGNNVTTLKAGAAFDVKWIIQAPHPGTMKLSIVKPSEDSTGKITYKNYKTILTVDPFAQNGGEDGTTATMPTDVTGCDSAGDCALQFYWHSDIANQTYPTCADIIVSGSGAGTSTNTKVTTAPTASSLETSDAGSSAQTTPSSNTTPSTEESADGSSAQTTPTAPSSNTTPSTNTTPTPATEAPEATTAPSTPTTESSVAGESDTNKCSRRMRRH